METNESGATALTQGVPSCAKAVGRISHCLAGANALISNNGRLTDAGLEHLGGLRYLMNFSHIGTAMKSQAFAKLE